MTKDVKKLSNPYSTGGGGYQFESHVQAAFVVLMLTDGHPPCFPNKKITKIKLQAKVDGFELDDMVVFMVDRTTEQEHKLLAQIKHTVAITNDNKTFKEVICAAWKDFNLPANFKKSKDKMALITGPVSAAETDNTRTILDWAHENGQNHIKYFEYIEKTNFSSDTKRKKLKSFEHNLKIANNDTFISDSDFFDFLKHFHFLGYDLDIKDGVTHSLLHSHIAQYYPSDAAAVWAQIVLHVQDVNKKSGTITLEDIPDEIKKYFKAPKLSYIPDEFVPDTSLETHKTATANKKAVVIANFIGGWTERTSMDDLDLIKRFVDGL